MIPKSEWTQKPDIIGDIRYAVERMKKITPDLKAIDKNMIQKNGKTKNIERRKYES